LLQNYIISVNPQGNEGKTSVMAAMARAFLSGIFIEKLHDIE